MSISSIVRFYILAAIIAVPCVAQRPALIPPVVRFSDSNGKPLVGGSLQSYQAGTTTPLATYSDSTTGALNTNPVVLDSTGSATVFLGPNVYKLVLKNSAGVVQWTADNIAQGMFSGSSVSGFTGNQGTRRTGEVTTLTGDYTCAMISGAVCSLPTPPTLYYQTVKTVAGTSPQQPILTLLPGTVGAIYTFTASGGSGYTTAPTVTFTGGGCAVEPTGGVSVASGAVTNPVITTAGSGCTTPPVPGFSGGGGSGATGATTLTPLGISCANNTAATSTDCTFTFAGGSGNAQACVRSDVTGSRSINGTYQNTTNGLLYMSGTVNTSGSSTGSYYVWQGTSSPSLSGYGNTATATISGGSPGFFEAILPGYFYQLRSSDPAITGISKWTEVTGCGSSTSTAGLAPPITNNLTIGSTGAGNPSRDSGIAPGNVLVTNPSSEQGISASFGASLIFDSSAGGGDVWSIGSSPGRAFWDLGNNSASSLAVLTLSADGHTNHNAALLGVDSCIGWQPNPNSNYSPSSGGAASAVDTAICKIAPGTIAIGTKVNNYTPMANQLGSIALLNGTFGGSVSAASMNSGGSPVCTTATGCTGSGSGVLKTTVTATVPNTSTCSNTSFTLTGLTSTMAISGSTNVPNTGAGGSGQFFFNYTSSNTANITVCGVVGGSSPSLTWNVVAQ